MVALQFKKKKSVDCFIILDLSHDGGGEVVVIPGKQLPPLGSV